MALQPKKPGAGKPVKGAPVTAHPLFPAVVALWFGALFGLGSLAIRVGLLESMVLATRIDTVIPAAGPPLGLSARILLALTLAALGAVIGVYIARKLAEPKAVVRERKRKAVLSEEETVSLRSRDAHPDAPARRPLSVHDDVDQQDGTAPSSAATPVGEPMAGRRRSALAIEHEAPFELHELAPLPGGGAPQIHSADAEDDSPLELGSYETTDELPPLTKTPTLDWHRAAEHHADEPVSADLACNFSPPADALPGRQIFGMSHPQPDEVLDELGITDAEFEPLPSSEAITFALPAAAEPAAPVDTDLAADGTGDASLVTDSGQISGDPAKLPMTALAQRLADSMQRRRDRAAQAAATAVVPTAVAASPAHDSRADQPDVQTAADFGAAPLDPESQSTGFAHPNEIPLPAPAASQPRPTDLRPGFGETGLSLETGLSAGLDVPDSPARLPAAFAAPASAPAVSLASVSALPAALRPLAIDALAEDDDEDDFAGFLPPRSFPGMGTISLRPEPKMASAEPKPSAALAIDPAEIGEPEDTSHYSSLLNVSRPAEARQTFVRIEDEPIYAPEIEPVVIFPGQLARTLPDPERSAGRESSAEHDETGTTFRKFDAPGSADIGEGVAPAASLPHDQGETERALRAALANLQRMSGAA